MTVSIIICTRNRAQDLGLTLESLASAALPPACEVELLVVDNGSSDHTANVVSGANLPGLWVRHLYEPRVGQCFARNLGLREATGAIILFTDDDVRVPRHWIEGMTAPIRNGSADAVAGGVAFPPAVNEALAFLKPGSVLRRSWFANTEELDRHQPERLVGANMAFGRHVLARVPEFDTALGPGALGFGDDTLFSWRLRRAGFRITGALDVAVEHYFDTSRLTPAAIAALAVKMGATTGYMDWHWRQTTDRWNDLRLLWLRLKLLAGQTRQRLFREDATHVPEWELVYRMCLARCEQYRRESRRPRRYQPGGASIPLQPDGSGSGSKCSHVTSRR